MSNERLASSSWIFPIFLLLLLLSVTGLPKIYQAGRIYGANVTGDDIFQGMLLYATATKSSYRVGKFDSLAPNTQILTGTPINCQYLGEDATMGHSARVSSCVCARENAWSMFFCCRPHARTFLSTTARCSTSSFHVDRAVWRCRNGHISRLHREKQDDGLRHAASDVAMDLQQRSDGTN
jgi:hypothetical protein